MQKLQVGDLARVGPYQIIARIGGGGMGRVYAGRSASGWTVAVKVIRAELAEDREFRARFTREVAAARQVSGLFTAPVVDADTDGPLPWLATAYVAGPSLGDAVREHGPLPAQSVRTLAARLAEGLASIHKAGVVHRDLKPANVLLAADGPRVIDFGIARALEGSTLTEAGTMLGSPGFMSPEQARGFAATPASDVFSLGAVLAFASTGRLPFGTGATAALVYRVVHGEPDLTGVPPELRKSIESCLAKDPARRPAAADLFTQFTEHGPHPYWLPAAVTATLARYEVPAALEGDGAPPDTESPRIPATRHDTRVMVPEAGSPRHRAPAVAHGRRRWRLAAALAAVAAIAATGAIWLANKPSGPPSAVIVPAKVTWYDTGVSLKAGQQVTMAASGYAYYGTGFGSGPDGLPECSGGWDNSNNPQLPAPGLTCASLVGRIGITGKPFKVGLLKQITATSGELYLSMNDYDPRGNSGGWTVHITISR